MAIAGRGLLCVMADHAASALADGRLVQVLAPWCPKFAGYQLYYPSRRQVTPAFKLFVDTLRHQTRRHLD
jgi:DNA-binding transcriptional LysR family regulator